MQLVTDTLQSFAIILLALVSIANSMRGGR